MCGTFGDIDVGKNRNYLYTLRTASLNSKLYLFEASSFLSEVTRVAFNANEFFKHRDKLEEKWLNALGKSLTNVYRGMNFKAAATNEGDSSSDAEESV